MKILKFWKTILIAITIFYGSISSSNEFNKVAFLNIKNIDKLIHFTIYFILAVSFLTSLYKNTSVKRINQIAITLFSVIIYGLLMEVFQYYFTLDRSADVLDFIANSLGCLFAISVFPLIIKSFFFKYL